MCKRDKKYGFILNLTVNVEKLDSIETTLTKTLTINIHHMGSKYVPVLCKVDAKEHKKKEDLNK